LWSEINQQLKTKKTMKIEVEANDETGSWEIHDECEFRAMLCANGGRALPQFNERQSPSSAGYYRFILNCQTQKPAQKKRLGTTPKPILCQHAGPVFEGAAAVAGNISSGVISWNSFQNPGANSRIPNGEPPHIASRLSSSQNLAESVGSYRRALVDKNKRGRQATRQQTQARSSDWHH